MAGLRSLFEQNGGELVSTPPVLSALFIELLNIGVLLSVTGGIANAMCAGVVPNNNRRALVTYLPSDPIVYIGMAGQISNVAINVEFFGGLQTLYSQLKAITTLTEIWVHAQAVETVSAAVEFETVVDGWQRLANAAHVLIVLTKIHLERRGVAHPSDRCTEILSALRAVSAGDYPCVTKSGSISIPGWAERRQNQRYRKNTQVEVTSASGIARARIQEISATGIGLVDVNGVARGDRLSVTLDENGRRLVGTVVWALDNRAGLQLTNPLSWDDPLLA